MWRKQLAVFSFITLSAAVATAAGPTPEDVRSVTSQLVCTCGCGNMIVANCSCSEADRVRADVSRLLTSGLSRDAVLERYAGIYGTEVLAAPPAQGFGLSAWALPFVALAIAAWLLNGLLRRWARAPSGVVPKAQKSADLYAESLEKEVQDA